VREGQGGKRREGGGEREVSGGRESGQLIEGEESRMCRVKEREVN
jgi:hypothetical protein